MNWESQRRSVSKSGTSYKLHALRWQRLPRMLQIKNNSSSHKQMVKMRLQNKSFNGKNNLGKSNRMGGEGGTILNEVKYQGIHKDRRKHYVVFHGWNRGQCTNTSRGKCWHSSAEWKIQITRPARWRNATDSKPTI